MNPAQFRAFLSSLSQSIHPVLGTQYQDQDFCVLDLSVSNPELAKVDLSDVQQLAEFIDEHIQKHHAKVAVGGYLEQRGIYQRSTYFKPTDPLAERNIHLGLDLWLKAGTPVYAPLEGLLHSFHNNTNFGDYGPTLILEHQFEEVQFYTLYGHLSLESLVDKRVGQVIEKGTKIATLGTAEVNGTYPPHLHFQIIKDLQGYHGDYPGVCRLKDLEFYKNNCPDPNLVLGL
jgi:hypothetical protein